jgi:hypothetical protein
VDRGRSTVGSISSRQICTNYRYFYGFYAPQKNLQSQQLLADMERLLFWSQWGIFMSLFPQGLRWIWLLCALAELLAPSIALGSEPKLASILKQSSPNGQGLVHTYSFVNAFHETQKKVERSPEADAAFLLVEQTLRHLDFDRLVRDPLGQQVDAQTRLYLLMGQQKGEIYRIDLAREAEVYPEALVSPLAFSQAWSIRRQPDPLPQEKYGYMIRSEGKLRLGSVSHKTFLSIANGLLRHARSTQTDPREDGIYSELRRALPQAMHIIDRYVHIQADYVERTYHQHSYLDVSMSYTLKDQALRADYPALAGYLENMFVTLSPQAKMRWTTSNGDHLADIVGDGTKRRLSIRLLLHEGRLLPRDSKGRPRLTDAIDLSQLETLSSLWHGELKAKLLGLSVHIPRVLIAWNVEAKPDPQLQIRMLAVDAPQITGALAGFLPAWALDVLIPGNLETYAQTFFEGLVKPQEQSPAHLYLKVRQDHYGYLASSQGSLVLVENSFLLLGLRTIQAHLWPKIEVREELSRLSFEQAGALQSDLQKLLAFEKVRPIVPL